MSDRRVLRDAVEADTPAILALNLESEDLFAFARATGAPACPAGSTSTPANP